VTPTSTPPHVVLRVPAGWRETALSPPDLSQTPSVHVLTWNAWGPEAPTSASLVAGCFGASPGTWTPEAEPIVLERLHATMSGVALRVARVGQSRVMSTSRDGYATREALEGQGDAEGQLSGQDFLGFVASAGAPPQLVGCFALCTVDLPACDASVKEATVAAEFVPPPAPTLSLRAVLAAVHHPKTSLGVALTLCFALATLLVATRRRPRTK
jgi:hypothetical protein